MSPLILLPWYLWYWWQYTVSGKKCNFREYLQKYFVHRLSWSDLLTNYQQNGNRVQCIVGRPSVAGVLVLISDWSISESNDVMLVTTPYKDAVENQGSETAGNLFMVGLSDYDVELGTKKRGRPFQRYQTWPTFRLTWGRRQGSNNVLFPPK